MQRANSLQSPRLPASLDLMFVQAGLRTLHEAGPEVKRAISGNLDEEENNDKDVEIPMHRVGITLYLCLLFFI